METVENWMSLREFARKRGVSLKAVQKAIKTGRVTAVKRDKNGRCVAIDLNVASAQWNHNTDTDQAARAGKAPMTAAGELAFEQSPAPATSAQETLPAGGEDPAVRSFLASRNRLKELEVEAAEREKAKALGQLVSSADLRTVNGRRYRALRDMLLNIPDRIATVVAAERDPARVHAAMTAEIKRVLNELSDDAAAEVARGVAQRVAA